LRSTSGSVEFGRHSIVTSTAPGTLVIQPFRGRTSAPTVFSSLNGSSTPTYASFTTPVAATRRIR
jgi:hypothetical protein